MITRTITEEEFRKDKDAVKALANFLASDAGQKFASAIRGGDPMTVLSSQEHQDKTVIRDLSVAEKANPDNLLGVCKGYRLLMGFIDSLTRSIDSKDPSKSRVSHFSKVSAALNQTPEQQ